MFAFVEPNARMRPHLPGTYSTGTTAIIWCRLCEFNVQTFMVGATTETLQAYHETVCINTTPEIREAAFNRLWSLHLHKQRRG